MKSKPEAQESVKASVKDQAASSPYPWEQISLQKPQAQYHRHQRPIQGNLEIPLHLPAGLHFFSSAFQDAGAPRASVGSPLDGQKVKLRPSPLSGLPLYLPSVLPFVSVCLSSRLCGNYTYGGRYQFVME